MLLNEFINQYPDDTVFSIGSGTSYFFIGTKEELEKEKDSINEKFVNDAKIKLKTLPVLLDELKSNPEKMIESRLSGLIESQKIGILSKQLEKENKDILKISKEEKASRLSKIKISNSEINRLRKNITNDINRKLNQIPKEINEAEKIVSEYKSFLEREVINSGERILSSGGPGKDIRVTITGNETGKYWTRKEYLTDRRK